MYKISEFSKLVGIPVRTLRYYAEYGILKPDVVDKFTNYKYYSDKNIIEAEMIKLLKSLDFTLDEIKSNDNLVNDNMLDKKKKEIENRIKSFKEKYERINKMQKELKENNKVDLIKINNDLLLKEEIYDNK